MQRKEEIKSGMKIENQTAPEGTVEIGKPFSIKGVITSNLKKQNHCIYEPPLGESTCPEKKFAASLAKKHTAAA